MKIGVFGGTFDPVHLGHLVLAEHAREQLSLHRVLWIPAGDPWRKSGKVISEARHRVEMVRQAIAGNARFELRQDEVERSGSSYTVDTLKEIHEAHPAWELFLLVGEDALADMPTWRDLAGIVELATLAVVGRAAQPAGGSLERLAPGAIVRTVRVDMPEIGISSTDIRGRVAARRSIRYLVPNEVETYIKTEALYES